MSTMSRARAALLVAGAISLLAAGPAAANGGHHGKKKDQRYQLTLLHNNDAESKLLTGDSVAGYGGAARFSTVLERIRRDAARRESGEPRRRGSVLVSSGDNFLAGLNLSASFAKGVPWYDSIAFDRFDYDAATIGNHEFDFGPDRLADFIRGTHRVPFLSANLDVSAVRSLERLEDRGRIAASTIVKRGGERIGIIGLTTPDLPIVSSPGDVTVDPALAEIANAEARRLDRRGADIVILSSHLQGIANEQALIPQLSGVDIVIAGGGDELLANPGNPLVPGAGAPLFPYPLLVTDANGSTVPVVTTAGEFRYVGRLTAVFDKRGRLESIDQTESLPVRVSGTASDPDFAEQDRFIVRRVDEPLLDYRAELDANVIAQTAVRLDGRNPDPIRARESNLGNLVADAFLATGDADVAITNGGGIRNNNVLPVGPISEGDTFRILPFDNIIVTVPGVPRDQLKALLENGYSVLSPVPGTVGFGGRFAHIAGMSVEIDRAQPVGSRVRRVVLDDGTVLVDGGNVVAGAAVDVATTDFLARGGDGYPFGGRPFVSTQVAYQASLFNYLTGPLAGQVTAAAYPEGGDGRIAITPALPPGPPLP
jgi:2',3'-cyclic-nucleotide 2'-phosphodiesterase (5'-nucleotidase family)